MSLSCKIIFKFISFRNKIDHNIHYAGTDIFSNLLVKVNSSFAFVAEKTMVESYEIYFKGLREFDFLKESLGNISRKLQTIETCLQRSFSRFLEFSLSLHE